jgi:hypothetical protein
MDPLLGEYPDLEIDPAIKDFFEKFYALSDDEDAHGAYADSFADEATLIMGSKSAKNKSSDYRDPSSGSGASVDMEQRYPGLPEGHVDSCLQPEA